VRLAPVRLASVSLAPTRLAFVRMAPVRSAPMSYAVVRRAPVRITHCPGVLGSEQGEPLKASGESGLGHGFGSGLAFSHASDKTGLLALSHPAPRAHAGQKGYGRFASWRSGDGHLYG